MSLIQRNFHVGDHLLRANLWHPHPLLWKQTRVGGRRKPVIAEALAGDNKEMQCMCPYRTNNKQGSSRVGLDSKPLMRRNLFLQIGKEEWILMEESITLTMLIEQLLGTDHAEMHQEVNPT